MLSPQKQTPTSGGNHTVGVNTHNTGAIVSDDVSPVKPSDDDYVRELVLAGNALLPNGGTNLALVCAPHTLFRRRIGSRLSVLRVRVECPGVLAIYDTTTGESLVLSMPSQPMTLQKI